MTQMPCKYCDDHPQILYDANAPEGKKVTNLDGTYHKHNKAQQQQHQETISFKDNEQLAKYTYEARQQGIEQAHKENMDASERLRQAIDKLADKLDKLVEAYLAREA